MFAAIFVLVICTGAIVAGWGVVKLARRMTMYRSVPGKIIVREVVASPGAQRRGGFMPYVKYSYAVDGTSYESDKIQFAIVSLSREESAARLDAIPDDVTVWYDPDAPSTAYLVRHTGGLGWVFIGFGAFGALCTLIWIAVRLTS